MVRQAKGYMAKARQNRIIASRERNHAVRNQIIAEDLAHQNQVHQRQTEKALKSARRDKAKYQESLVTKLQAIEAAAAEEKAAQNTRKVERDQLAATYNDREYKLPSIVKKTPRASPRAPSDSSWAFPSRHHPIHKAV